jgi:hypothetical protein
LLCFWDGTKKIGSIETERRLGFLRRFFGFVAGDEAVIAREGDFFSFVKAAEKACGIEPRRVADL